MGEKNVSLAAKKTAAPQAQTQIKLRTPIISYSGRRVRKRRALQPKRMILPLFCLLFAFLMLFSYAEKRLSPRMKELAELNAKKHLLETVNRTVGEMAREGLLSYDLIVNTIRDEKGEVIYLEVNTARLAEAKSNVVERISQELQKKKTISITVPLGSLGNSTLLSGIGLPFWLRLIPVESAEGEIYTVLEDCGINQTRHMIQISVQVSLAVLLPGDNVLVETEVVLPLGERVLVGEVPEIYLDTIGANP